MKEVYVLRHGEKDEKGNLTERGKKFARQLGSIVPTFTVVIASNSPRTIETASLLTGKTPVTDDRAGYYNTTQEVSGDIAKLAAERSLTFLEAANMYNDGELVDGIQTQATALNSLADETLAGLDDGETALIVSHDMTMTPAMIQRGEQPPAINYLSGYILREDGALLPFEAQQTLSMAGQSNQG